MCLFRLIYLLCVDARQITVLISPPIISSPLCALPILLVAFPIVSSIPPLPLRTYSIRIVVFYMACFLFFFVRMRNENGIGMISY